MKLHACQAKIAYSYKNTKLKLFKTIENIDFNRKCLEYGLVPKYVSVKIRNKSRAAMKAKKVAEETWIKNEIKSLYKKKDMINKLLIKKHLELLNCLHPSQQNGVFNELETQITRKIQIKKKTQAKKLTSLSDSQLQREIIACNHTFHPRVVNKTDIMFTEPELNLLNKGLNFNFPNSKKNSLLSELFNAETAIKYLKTNDAREASRVMISRKIEKVTNNPAPRNKYLSKYSGLKQIAASIRRKLEDNESVIAKADKGNCIVILKKVDYVNKVHDFINANEIVSINRDPTLQFSKDINKLISSSTNLLSNDEIKQLKVTNPQAPALRGLPKIHKANIPIRPLVNFTPSPAYKVAKKLDAIIRKETVLSNNQSIKNSCDLVEKIAHVKVNPHHILASFDIVSLFTNVPIGETMNILKENLSKNSSLSNEAQNELLKLTASVLKQNYFIFDDKFYIQRDGMAMGSPLSSVLTEIFLNKIENDHLWSNLNRQKDRIIFYFRYVDDTIVLFNGNRRQLNLLNTYLNNIHKNIKFTLEVEDNNSINFLDLTISKNNSNFDFKIYRKPTTTDQTIHESSHHPYNQKLAAYNSLIHRLLSLPLSQENYCNEVNIIKYIAVANGYKSSMVDKLINKHNNKTNNQSNSEEKKYICTEYGVTLNNTLQSEMSKNNVTVSFKTSNKLSSLLKSRKQANDKSDVDKTGIYKIKCNDCPVFYIGQTSRSFSKRFKEHLPRKSTKSAYANHLINSMHNYSDINKNLEILHFCKKGNFMNTIEEFEIYKSSKENPQFLLNDKLAFESNIIYNRALTIISDGDYRTNSRRDKEDQVARPVTSSNDVPTGSHDSTPTGSTRVQ